MRCWQLNKNIAVKGCILVFLWIKDVQHLLIKNSRTQKCNIILKRPLSSSRIFQLKMQACVSPFHAAELKITELNCFLFPRRELKKCFHFLKKYINRLFSSFPFSIITLQTNALGFHILIVCYNFFPLSMHSPRIFLAICALFLTMATFVNEQQDVKKLFFLYKHFFPTVL